EQSQPVLQEDKAALTVLAVDDNPANLKLITALLAERVTHVVACSSGQEAVELASKTPFDLIFMDIQMPQMDGVTACKQIKEGELNRQTPVIAVTAHAMSGERDRLLKAGMDDYLTKPIEEHILQQVLVHWNPNTCDQQLNKIGPCFAEVDQVPTSQPQAELKADVIIDWQAALKQSAK